MARDSKRPVGRPPRRPPVTLPTMEPMYVDIVHPNTGEKMERMLEVKAREMFHNGKLDWDVQHKTYCYPRPKLSK
jgi:hypothetical protein